MKTALLLFATFTSAAVAEWRWQDAIIPDAGLDLDAAAVVRVTSLESDGKGSLRAALRLKGPRLIVFEVGGVIDLQQRGIEIVEPGAFVAGQTAPAPGITIIRGGIDIEADRTVLQHLAVRPGDAGQKKRSGWEPDGITTSGGPVDVWVDHCSITWAVDENLSASTYKSPTGQPARRIFFRDCIVAEGLNDATHKKGPHSKGSLVFGGTQEVAIVGCLYASNVERNPVFQVGTSGAFVNNVVANPGQRAIHVNPPDRADKLVDTSKARIAVVGNLVLYGRETKKSARAIFEGNADAHFAGNEGYDWLGQPLDLLRAPFTTLPKAPVWPEGLKPVTAAAAMWRVTRFAGARPAERDPIDQRIVSTAITGQARIIDSQEEVGGYPKHAPVTRALPVPEEKRREWLEKLARAVTFASEP